MLPLYPDPDCIGVRKALTRHFKNIREENTIVGNGSCELIYLFAQSFAGPQDEVIIPFPTFGEYERAAAISGAKIFPVPLNDDFSILADQIIERFSPHTKIVFLCNPNNPTSQLIPKNELMGIIKAAQRKGILIFVDEDFMDFVSPPKNYTLIDDIDEFPNVFVLRSLTKTHAVPGLRIGYGLSSPEVIELLYKVKPPWNVNALAQAAALEGLKDPQYMQRTSRYIEVEKHYLQDEISNLRGLRLFPADANFLFIDVSESPFTAPQLKKKLLQSRILIRDCSSFRGLDDHYIRVAIRKRHENASLTKALKKILKKGAK